MRLESLARAEHLAGDALHLRGAPRGRSAPRQMQCARASGHTPSERAIERESERESREEKGRKSSRRRRRRRRRLFRHADLGANRGKLFLSTRGRPPWNQIVSGWCQYWFITRNKDATRRTDGRTTDRGRGRTAAAGGKSNRIARIALGAPFASRASPAPSSVPPSRSPCALPCAARRSTRCRRGTRAGPPRRRRRPTTSARTRTSPSGSPSRGARARDIGSTRASPSSSATTTTTTSGARSTARPRASSSSTTTSRARRAERRAAPRARSRGGATSSASRTRPRARSPPPTTR